MRIRPRHLLVLGLLVSIGACAQPAAVGPSGPPAPDETAPAYQVQQLATFWRWSMPLRSAWTIENDIYSMVNRVRMRRGLSPLTHVTALRLIARRHSMDMISRAYLSEITPDRTTPGGQARAAGIPFGQSGTNVRSLTWRDNLVHDVLYEPGAGWMTNPEQRSKILRSSYDQMGVGVWRDRQTGNLYVTLLLTGRSSGGG